MRTDEIRTDGTEYAVARHESDGLGDRGLFRCVVLATGVDRRTRGTGRGFGGRMATDGVRVREVEPHTLPDTWAYDEATGERHRVASGETTHREYVVRPQAVKGLWGDHEAAMARRAERDAARRQEADVALAAFDDAVERLRGHALTGYVRVDRYAREVHFNLDAVVALADRLDAAGGDTDA